MDKIFEPAVVSRKRRKIVLTIVFIVILLVCAVFMLRSSVTPTKEMSSISTAVVEQGDIENTLTASGEVLPEFEEVITSPINASIQNVLLDAGSNIKAGQSLLTLDKSAAQTEYTKLKFELESKRNELKKLKLELGKSFYDIQSNNNIKQLRIDSYKTDVENARRLHKAGGGTREEIEKAELNLKVAQLEKQQLENEIKNKQQTMQVEIREAEIAAAIQQNELQELERKLKLANIVASRNGVVTWVNKNIGESIQAGDALARIADLNSFKVQGSISDNYIDQLKNGMPAIIRANDIQMKATVVNIQPAVKNNVVSFDLQLDEKNNKLLRPNLKVEVFLVTASKNNVLRVTNGPAFKGTPTQDIFVVANGKAERRTVNIGLSNFDFVEIKDNVKPGDVLIISDMSDYKNTREITIKN